MKKLVILLSVIINGSCLLCAQSITDSATHTALIDSISNRSIRGSVVFTPKEVRKYAKVATKNSAAQKVMLGKYVAASKESYNNRAGKTYTYFQLDNWEVLFKKVGGSANEMWRINKEFLNEQWKARKKLFFSHNPTVATGYYAEEIDYLKKKGIKHFKKSGKNLWQATL